MAKRRTNIPLYELMGRSPRSAGDDVVDGPEPGGPLSPGRAFRVPVGYLFLAAAACLLLLIGAYVLGYQRGAAVTKARYGEQLRPNLNDPGAQVSDPLGPNQRLRTGTGEGSGGGTLPPALDVSGPEVPGGAENSGEGWGPLESDPRVAGRYYRVLIETHAAGAREVGRFLREKGLESYVISGKNTRLRVIVLPGFSWLPERFDPDSRVQALYEQTATVGRQWVNERNGTTDFSDAYWVLYTP